MSTVLTIVIVVIIAIPISIISKKLISKWMAKREKKKEIAQAVADRQRDESLNSVILNQHVSQNGNREVYTPYDVDYGKGAGARPQSAVQNIGSNPAMAGRMVQLEEKSELSTRKFVLNASKGIKIGSSMTDNDVSVQAKGVEPSHCEIFEIQGHVFVKNTAMTSRTLLRRRKNQAIVDNNGIELMTGDTIFVGSVGYTVTLP